MGVVVDHVVGARVCLVFGSLSVHWPSWAWLSSVGSETAHVQKLILEQVTFCSRIFWHALIDMSVSLFCVHWKCEMKHCLIMDCVTEVAVYACRSLETFFTQDRALALKGPNLNLRDISLKLKQYCLVLKATKRTSFAPKNSIESFRSAQLELDQKCETNLKECIKLRLASFLPLPPPTHREFFLKWNTQKKRKAR